MSVFSERVPPQNLEAERSVLGAILIDDREVLTRVASFLKPEDFYSDRHQIIYQAMLDLWSRGEPVDLITVSEELRKLGRLEAAGGITYLSDLARLVPTTANAEAYAEIVEQKAVLRRLQHAAREIIEEAYDAEDLDEMLNTAESKIFAVTQRRTTRSYEHIREALYAAYDHLEFLYQHKGGTTGVPSGYPDLDEKTSGWQPSDLIIIAARPSMGKTAFALNLVRNAAVRAKKTVGFFSLEMSKEQIALRLLAMESAVDGHKLRTGYLTDEDWHHLSAGLSRLAEAEIYIDDTPNLPLMELRARARRMKAEHGLDLLCIDYMQLMTLGGGARRPTENRAQEVAEISRSLKALARELNIPIIALSQLSRAVESRTDKRPMLSDLRESGSIEQDADVVMFLYRDDYYNQDTDRKNIVEVIIAKQRNGPVGTVELVFLKEFGKFMSLDRRHS
ncbi:MAG: replicative DNA helicase [Bacillota bacterium]|nr:MAG: replicative DNA helicase [Bacillota bacterium]